MVDLSPLAYVAGTIMGISSIRVFDGPPAPLMRTLVPSPEALAGHQMQPLQLLIKEHLAVMNGTAFSTSVGALAIYDAAHLAVLALVLTALGTEVLMGARGSFSSFIHSVARPHPGQVR
jgi:phenylalanine ammonia-lyase